jgi:transposase
MENISELNFKQSDHDLLVKLDQKVNDLKDAVKELQSGTYSRISALEKDKADRVELEFLQKRINDDIEVRVRKLESKTANYKITLMLYSIAVGGMIALICYHILR